MNQFVAEGRMTPFQIEPLDVLEDVRCGFGSRGLAATICSSVSGFVPGSLSLPASVPLTSLRRVYSFNPDPLRRTEPHPSLTHLVVGSLNSAVYSCLVFLSKETWIFFTLGRRFIGEAHYVVPITLPAPSTCGSTRRSFCL